MRKYSLVWAPLVCVVIAGCSSKNESGGSAGATSAGAGAAPPVTSAPVANLSTPKDAAMSFGRAMESGDLAAAEAAAITDAQTKPLLDAMVPLVGSMKKLTDAAVAKFGEAGKQVAGSNTNPGLDIAKDINDSEVKETGDTATLTPKKGGEPLKLKKVDGQWKVDMTALTKGQNEAAAMAMALPMFKGMTKAADETTAEINSGKYKTADEAKKALNAKMMASMMGGMGAQPGGPMGGGAGMPPGPGGR